MSTPREVNLYPKGHGHHGETLPQLLANGYNRSRWTPKRHREDDECAGQDLENRWSSIDVRVVQKVEPCRIIHWKSLHRHALQDDQPSHFPELLVCRLLCAL